MFSSKSFTVSGFTLKYLIHFGFVFVYDVRKYSSFILLHVAIQFLQHHLLNRLYFLHCMFLPPLSNINLLQVCRFIAGPSLCYSIGPYIIFVPMLNCFYYCGFVLLSEIWRIKPLAFFLFPKDCFGKSGSLVVPYTFQDYLLYFCEKCHGQFNRDHIKCVDCFGYRDHFNNINSFNPGT